MTQLTGLTLGGKTWIPQFIQKINQDKCIGCGRCSKACPRDLLRLRALNEEGEFVENEEYEAIDRKVMTIVNPEYCIGCRACARICLNNCYTYAPYDLVD
jgi:Nif-specific ferredoxin III